MRAAQTLSERYRAERLDQSKPLATGRAETLGYAALILPATYAQLYGAMAATAVRIRNWTPTTLLDIGSGPGTAFWAATTIWPSLKSLVAWERESAFIALGQELARGSQTTAIRSARWERVDLRQLPPAPQQRFDLVVLGHVLNELSSELQRVVIDYAWQLTGGVLLLVEPGTSAVFPGVRAARDQLLQAGAHTIAPCAHDANCPLVDDWCHFPQRLKRPDFQRRARGAPSEWEDSKFSYMAMARFAADQPIWGRAIREATSNKAYAEIMLSTQTDVARYRALKRHREAYRQVRAIEWGDVLAAPLTELIAPVAEDRRPVQGLPTDDQVNSQAAGNNTSENPDPAL